MTGLLFATRISVHLKKRWFPSLHGWPRERPQFAHDKDHLITHPKRCFIGGYKVCTLGTSLQVGPAFLLIPKQVLMWEPCFKRCTWSLKDIFFLKLYFQATLWIRALNGYIRVLKILFSCYYLNYIWMSVHMEDL